MMNTKKRWLAALLSVVMVVAMLPSMAFAAAQPEPITGLEFDAKTSVLTFNKVAYENGTGLVAANAHEVKLQCRDKVSQNDKDWKDIPGLSLGDASDVENDASKAFLKFETKLVTFSKELSYRFTVTTKANEKDYFAAIGYTPVVADATVADFDVKLAPNEGGLRTTVTLVNGERAATDLKVTLYKTGVAMDGNTAFKNLPADAVKVSEKTVKAYLNETNVVVDFPATDFTWEDPTKVWKVKNNYFVTVVGSRTGMKDSAPVFSKDQVVASETTGKSAVPTSVSLNTDGIVVAQAPTDAVITVQLFDATDITKAVGEAVTKDGAGASDVTFDMSKFVTKKGLYFAKVTAKETGKAVSEVVATESKTLLPKDKVQDITAVMDEFGAVDVDPGKTTDNTANGVKFVVLYKGNVVSKEVVQSIGVDINSDAWMNSAKVQLVVGTPAPTKKNLSDFALKIVGTRAGLRDSNEFVVSYGGQLAIPTGAAWDGSKNNPTAKWNAVEGAEEYIVTFKEGVNVVKTVVVKGTSANLLDSIGNEDLLKKNTQYFFTVQAKAGYKLSPVATSFKPNYTTANVNNFRVAEPKNVKWDGSKAAWDAVYGADYYVVRKLVNGKQVGPDCKTTANFYQFKGMKKPGAYEFTVRAYVDAEGYLGSKEVKAENMKLIEKATVGTPYITKASKTRTTVKLRWTAADNAQVYRIYYKTKGMDSYKMIVKSVRGDATAKTIKGLKKGTRYSFKVKAVNSGAAAYSNVKVVTTTK